jgi:2-hydroxymuconate-semialdehyde hydrolase
MALERMLAGVSGLKMAYADLGEGPPVVLIHGFPTSADLWAREAFLLASRMRVIAPDLVGYGESDKPADRDLSARAQAGYVRELLTSLGIDEFAVVGHGLGGRIAQLLALGRGVPAMVLLDSARLEAGHAQGVRPVQKVRPEQENAEFAEGVVRVTFDMGMAHPDRLDETTLRAFLGPWKRDPAAFLRVVEAIDAGEPAGGEADLAELDAAAFLIWGEEDPFFPPENAERLGGILEGSAIALLPGCSHFVNLDAPQTVGPLIFEFLRMRYLGESHGPNDTGSVQVFLERPPAAELTDPEEGDED